MFNKKSFLIFLMFLFIVSVFNLFNEVTLEYVGISLNLYKEFEVKCGTVFEILSNIGNPDFMDSLGVNRRSCIGSAVVKIINFFTTTLVLLLSAYLGLKYFKKIETREDLSDLISILKRRNSK
ncbi:MAG: hypothetical protein CMD06_00205 [Flavobacteriales bacterium]|nr:hypothetical protein [Flavobacteriales bacterium]